jgi:hypothetical protein
MHIPQWYAQQAVLRGEREIGFGELDQFAEGVGVKRAIL